MTEQKLPSVEDIKFSFAEVFPGMIWKSVVDEESKRIFVECRDPQRKQVSFSAVSLDDNQVIMREVTFDEPWWISLAAVWDNVLLLTLYNDHDNPDKKSLLACDVLDHKIRWWRNNFALDFAGGGKVRGMDTKFGARVITLDAKSGEELPADTLQGVEQNLKLIKPFQYYEGTTHFETIAGFLEPKCGILPVKTIEYSEYHSLIIISAFVGQNDLANYLFVFNSSGNLLLKETLGEHLKGIAPDTFFVFSGYLIFVKNKCELVSYKFV